MKKQTNKYNHRWHCRKMLFNQAIPVDVSHWLFDVSSLTKRLQTRCPNAFSVKLLSQTIAKPSLGESCVLSIPTGRSALIREVLLCCGEKSVVYARTIIPLTTLTGAQTRYGNLGNRPLGAMLFSDRNMTRDEVEVTAIAGKDLLSDMDISQQLVWGRRSVFRVAKKPLLVSEYFLPDLFT